LSDPKGDEGRDVKNGDAVLLDLEGWKSDEPPTEVLEESDSNKKELFQKAKSWLVIVGEKDVTDGLDLGLANMKEGQVRNLNGLCVRRRR